MLHFDPFRDLDRLGEQLLAAANGGSTGSARSPRLMPFDIYRAGDHYVLHADLPGIDPGSIDVQVDAGTLTLTAERTPATEDGVQWLAYERPTGRLQRRVALGDNIDTEHITASYDNGVITVTIPVAERAKPRQIPVVTGQAGSTVIDAERAGQALT